MSFKLLGLEQMKANLLRAAAKFPALVEAALYQEAQIEMTESKRRVPVEHGILRGSGTVHRPTRSGRRISVMLSYGGPAEAYAIVQHERLDYLHPRGGQAKYLESVLNESMPHMAARLATRMDLNKVKL